MSRAILLIASLVVVVLAAPWGYAFVYQEHLYGPYDDGYVRFTYANPDYGRYALNPTTPFYFRSAAYPYFALQAPAYRDWKTSGIFYSAEDLRSGALAREIGPYDEPLPERSELPRAIGTYWPAGTYPPRDPAYYPLRD